MTQALQCDMSVREFRNDLSIVAWCIPSYSSIQPDTCPLVLPVPTLSERSPRVGHQHPAPPGQDTKQIRRAEGSSMSKSLLEALPGIVAAGKRQGAQVLEQLESRNRVTLQTRELVIPSRDVAQGNLLRSSTVGCNGFESPSRLIYGDNLLALAALLGGDDENTSLRGQVDLIYADPPFDSKADYRTLVTLPGATLEQRPTIVEQFAYSDAWSEGTASYLAMITPRLVLMRELLSNVGSLYVHLDWHVGHYVKIVLDNIFGKENLINEVIWAYTGPSNTKGYFPRKHDTLFWYRKTDEHIFNGDAVRVPYKKLATGKTSGIFKEEHFLVGRGQDSGGLVG